MSPSHNRALLNREAASTLFELLVFLPLFLFFVIVVVDLGLAFQEYSKFSNTSRALNNTATAMIKSDNFLRAANLTTDEIDIESATVWLENLVERFSSDISSEKSIGDSSAPQFSLQGAILMLEIDQVSGDIISRSTDEMIIAYASYPPSQLALAAHSLNNRDYIEPRDFISQQLEIASKHSPSLYAQPLTSIATLGGTKFKRTVPLLYLELSAEASGLKRFGVYSLLGKFFTLQDQQLVVIRK